MENENFEVTEEVEQKSFEPFTLEDALDDEANENVCLFCIHRETCPIIIYVNKLSMKRDNKVLDDEFYCPTFTKEDIEEESHVW